MRRKTIFIIILLVIVLIMVSGLFWKVEKKEMLSIIYGDWEFQRELIIKEDGESAFPIGAYSYDDPINKEIPSYIISTLSLESSYEIIAADGLITHQLTSGAIVEYYIQPVYQQSELIIKNLYRQKKCILLEPQPPKMKMNFTNIRNKKDFEEIYEAGEDGLYRYIDK